MELGMLWGALWPLLLCVCINTHHSCSDNNLKPLCRLDGKKKKATEVFWLHLSAQWLTLCALGVYKHQKLEKLFRFMSFLSRK